MQLNELDMSSYLIALHRCHVLLVIYIFSSGVIYSPVDSELGGDHQYLDDPSPYPAEEGKRSPTYLIPACKVFYLHTIQIYFAATIVAFGICLQILSTAPSMTSAGFSALLELFLLYMLSCYYIWSGNYPRR